MVDTIHQDLEEIKREITLIKNILSEDYELSDSAVKALQKARRTSKSDYISQEEIKMNLL